MQVVLQKSLTSLGKKGEVVTVKPGYARNFLVPQGIALSASAANIQKVQATVAQNQKAKKELLTKLVAMQAQISRLHLKFAVSADAAGKLYGSVGKLEIQKALAAKISLKVPQTKIDLEKPIKKIGEYVVALKLDPKIKTKFSLTIVPKEVKKISKK